MIDLALLPEGVIVAEESYLREGVLSAVMFSPDGIQLQLTEPVITFVDGSKTPLSDYLEAHPEITEV